MQLDYLRTLVTVMERGGFSAAARALGISQPAVSQQIQRLESELKVSLLRRGRQRVVEITSPGELVLDFARTTLTAYDALRQKLDRQRDTIAGELRLAASTIPGEYLVPQLVADFRAQHPGVEALVTIDDTAAVVQKMMAGECDLGFIGAPVEQPRLTLECLAADEVRLVVFPEHPLAGREKVTWEEVLEQPLIIREEGSGTRRTVEETLAAQGKTLPAESVALTLGSTQAIVQAVRDRLGIGFISQRAIDHVPPAERLPSVPIEGLRFTRDLFIVYDAARLTSPLSRAFLAFVQQSNLRSDG